MPDSHFMRELGGGVVIVDVDNRGKPTCRINGVIDIDPKEFEEDKHRLFEATPHHWKRKPVASDPFDRDVAL